MHASELGEPVAIVGAGLLGGSLALALEQAGWPVSLIARREEVAGQWAESHERSAIVPTTDPNAALAEARLVVLAVPPEGMATALASVLRASPDPRNLLVTDLGSVKLPIETELQPLCEEAGARFIGSHPMAGSEHAGLAHARADLLRDARCAVCPPAGANAADTARIEALWRAAGCRTLRLGAAEHDRAVARVSHLVHLAAGALIRAVAAGGEEVFDLAGPGLRDSTRVAAGPVPLWLEITAANRDSIVDGLDDLRELLNDLRDAVDGGDTEALARALDEARELRMRLLGGNSE